ncbi:MAG: hypothetical protein VYE73_09020 [Acidobacteriota bacterium]|nr:hypothetical protein [Acidobacteriota bacterium]
MLLMASCSAVPQSDGSQSVQGAGHISPQRGRYLELVGTVTAIDKRERSPRFWIALPEDGDPRTSDGLRIDLPIQPQVGARVELSGMVREARAREGELSVTHMSELRVKWNRDVVPLPEPVEIGPGGRPVPRVADDDAMASFDPDGDALDYFESLEGMRVRATSSQVVGPTTRFGEVVVEFGYSGPSQGPAPFVPRPPGDPLRRGPTPARPIY